LQGDLPTDGANANDQGVASCQLVGRHQVALADVAVNRHGSSLGTHRAIPPRKSWIVMLWRQAPGTVLPPGLRVGHLALNGVGHQVAVMARRWTLASYS